MIRIKKKSWKLKGVKDNLDRGVQGCEHIYMDFANPPTITPSPFAPFLAHPVPSFSNPNQTKLENRNVNICFVAGFLQ